MGVDVGLKTFPKQRQPSQTSIAANSTCFERMSWPAISMAALSPSAATLSTDTISALITERCTAPRNYNPAKAGVYAVSLFEEKMPVHLSLWGRWIIAAGLFAL